MGRRKKKNKKGRSVVTYNKVENKYSDDYTDDEELDWMSGSYTTVMDDGYEADFGDIFRDDFDEDDDEDVWDADDYMMMSDDDEDDEDY